MMIRMAVPVGPTRRKFESLLLRLPTQVREALKQQIESSTDPETEERVMLQALVKYSSPAPHQDRPSAEEFANVT